VASRKLVLNAAPIGLPEVQVTVGHLPYDKDVLERLRRQQAGELLAQRHEDVIEAIPLVADAPMPGARRNGSLSLPRAPARHGDRLSPAQSGAPLLVATALPIAPRPPRQASMAQPRAKIRAAWGSIFSIDTMRSA